MFYKMYDETLEKCIVHYPHRSPPRSTTNPVISIECRANKKSATLQKEKPLQSTITLSLNIFFPHCTYSQQASKRARDGDGWKKVPFRGIFSEA